MPSNMENLKTLFMDKETHRKLKMIAAKNYRPMTQQLAFMIDKEYSNEMPSLQQELE
jgi:hypothetical protein